MKKMIANLYIQINHIIIDYRNKVNKNASISLAYYLIMSIVPICSLCAFLASLLNIDLSNLEVLLTEYLTPEFSNIVTSSLTAKHISFSSMVVLIISLYVVSKGIDQMYEISKTLFNYASNRNFIVERMITIFKTLIVLILLMLITSLLTFIPIIDSFINLSDSISFNNSYLFLVLFISLSLIYKIIPGVKIAWIDTLKGSTIASILLLLLILGLKYYFSISDYTTVYGPLASFVVIMITFMFVSEIIYIGMYIISKNN
ncbi:YhjD/YihY/BrkB family envelope integrity protein [Thomasclavelia sp.]|uniref:YhjD/YihY/BrkB family envelope integrity protein n=1 Tax=Thomasclavelia sp. TaxID=3025757 RepID=UPI00262284FF|nr:YhjD/YihY/BrkB family envelope integrity protein [Thomasclavelia sp.]